MCTLVAQTSVNSQMPIAIQNFDDSVFKKTVEKVYDIWESSSYSNELEIDTILCAYILRFDTLDLVRVAMDENALKENLWLSLNANEFYDCECQVYDDAGENVASFGVFNFYYVFRKSHYNSWYTEPLRERILDHEEIVFIPQSRVHLFNFQWRVIATKNGDLRWLHLDDPDLTYSSSEVYHEHLEKFILRTTQPDSVSVITKPGFMRIRLRRQ